MHVVPAEGFEPPNLAVAKTYAYPVEPLPTGDAYGTRGGIRTPNPRGGEDLRLSRCAPSHR